MSFAFIHSTNLRPISLSVTGIIHEHVLLDRIFNGLWRRAEYMSRELITRKCIRGRGSNAFCHHLDRDINSLLILAVFAEMVDIYLYYAVVLLAARLGLYRPNSTEFYPPHPSLLLSFSSPSLPYLISSFLRQHHHHQSLYPQVFCPKIQSKLELKLPQSAHPVDPCTRGTSPRPFRLVLIFIVLIHTPNISIWLGKLLDLNVLWLCHCLKASSSFSTFDSYIQASYSNKSSLLARSTISPSSDHHQHVGSR